MSRSKLTPEKIAEIQEEFNKFDINGDGRITIKEILKTDKTMTRLDAKMMMIMGDANGDGKIDFDEFLAMMEIDLEDDSNVDKLIFKFFDKDHDGLIDAKELSKVMAIFGLHISINEAEQKIKELNPKIPGKLNLEGETEMLISINIF